MTFAERRDAMLASIGVAPKPAGPRPKSDVPIPHPRQYRAESGVVYADCGRKVRFKLEHEAERKAKEYGLNSYPCPHCQGYHLTRREYRPGPRRHRP